MTRKRYIEANECLSYEELENRYKSARNFMNDLISDGKVLTVYEFFTEHPELEDKLRNTSMFGFPSNALFACKKFTEGFCNQMARLFAIYSKDPAAKIVTGINPSIALSNFKAYQNNPTHAHHTWTELEIDEKEYVVDLADQKVYEKQDYYKMYNYHEDDLAMVTTNAAILQEFTPYSFVCAANRIVSITHNQQTLDGAYEDFIVNLFLPTPGVSLKESKYAIEELGIAHSKLKAAGLSSTSKSDSFIIDSKAAGINDDYIFNYSNGVSQFLTEETKADPTKYKILSNVFPETEIMAKQCQIQGPLESIANMAKQFE